MRSAHRRPPLAGLALLAGLLAATGESSGEMPPAGVSPVVAAAQLVAAPGAERALRAPVSGTIDSFLITAGRPASRDSELVTYDLRELQAELERAQRSYRELAARRRSDGGTSGGSSSTGANRGAASAPSAIPRSPEHDAMAEVLDVQERIARSRLVAPEDGWVLRPLVSTGIKIKRKAPLLAFVPADRVRLEAEVPSDLAAVFPPGAAVTVSREEGGGETAQGIVAPGQPTPAPGGTVRFAIRLAALPPFALGEPLRVALGPAP